jgi:hypothetical protein
MSKGRKANAVERDRFATRDESRAGDVQDTQGSRLDAGNAMRIG